MIKLNLKFYLITIAAILVFLPSLQNGFVNWDDPEYVINNPLLSSISFYNIQKIFTSHLTGKYHPLTLIVLLIEKHFFGLNAAYFHFISLVFHLLNIYLVYILIEKLFGDEFVSYAVCFLFAIHPLNVEAIAWVSSQKDLFFALFYFLGLIFYLNYRKERLTKYYFLSFFCFLVSILFKAMAVTFPIVLILIDVYQNKKLKLYDAKNKIPFFVFSGILGFITYFSAKNADGFPNTFVFGIVERIFYSFYALFLYFSKIVLPINLSCHYPPTTKLWLIISAMVSVLFVIVFICYSERKDKKIIFGLSFFLLTIFPVLHFFVINDSAIYDRFQYVPSIGMFIVISVFLKRMFKSEFVKDKRLLKIIVSFIMCLLCILSLNRVKVWHDSEGLWLDVLSKYNNSYPALNNLGNYYENKSNYEYAEVLYLKMIDSFNYDPKGYINLGRVWFLQNQFQLAEQMFSKVLILDPMNKEAYNFRGIVNFKLGKNDLALDDLAAAIEIDKDFEYAYTNRAAIYKQLGLEDLAKKDMRKVTELDSLSAMKN